MSALTRYRVRRDDGDVLRDREWEFTALAPDVLDWLAWLELANRSDATLYSYEWRLSKACLLFPRKVLKDWTVDECATFLRSFPKKSRHVAFRQMNGFFEWAVKQDRITRNPMNKLPDMKGPGKKHIDVFSEAEIEDLYTLPIVDRALMGILFECGLRKAEARKLQVRRIKLGGHDELGQQVGRTPAPRQGNETDAGGDSGASGNDDFAELFLASVDAGYGADRERDQEGKRVDAGAEGGEGPQLQGVGELVVIAGKGAKDRTVQFGARLHGMLTELLFLEPLNPQDYLWYMRPGGGPILRERPVVDASFDRWWRSCLHEAGVRYRTPHVARHTYATRWLRRGGRMTTLSQQMGHSSIAVTVDYYGHLETTDVLRDLAIVEGRA